ncbi:hypothetical protein F8Y87_24895 [Vibrio alginolyticus]|nr:hypothetical protein [Vibrio alginolyticus]
MFQYNKKNMHKYKNRKEKTELLVFGKNDKIKSIIISVLVTLIGILLGVIGVLLAINTYVIDLENKKDELNSILYKAEISSDYGGRFEIMGAKIAKLEAHLYNIEKIKPYYDIKTTLPEDLEEQRALLERVKRQDSSISKRELLGYIVQDQFEQLSLASAISFLSQMTVHDIDELVKISITPYRSTTHSFQSLLAEKLVDFEYAYFERAWLRYYKLDEQIAAFILSKYVEAKTDIPRASLVRLLNYSRTNKLRYTDKFLTKYLLEN